MADPVYIIPDNPVIVKDSSGKTEDDPVDFGFSAYIETIAGLIAHKKNKTPLVIGVYGKWGAGKTTLMQSISHRLETGGPYKTGKDSPYRACKTVWFQAWKYKDEDEILAALLEQIFKSMARKSFFDKIKADTEKAIVGVHWRSRVFELIKTVTSVDISPFFQESSHKERMGFYDEFEPLFKRLIWTYVSSRPQLHDSEEYDDAQGVLAVFIDDLDRCPKPRIVGVLETIKLFMDIPGCVFVIGAANDIISQALEKDYGENAERFMDKIIQVTFNLPKIPDQAFAPYLNSILKDAGLERDKDLEEFLPWLLPVLDCNPRNFKRFLNDLSLQKALITHKALEVAPRHLLLFNLFEKGFRPFYLMLRGEKGFRALEAIHLVLDEAKKRKIPEEEIGTEGHGITIPDSVAEFLKNPELSRLVDEFRPCREGLERLVTLSGIVESPRKTGTEGPPRSLGHHRQVLIPAGHFIYQDGETRSMDDDYEMDIYPVTHQQFERFIRAKGYQDQGVWSDEGWAARERGNWEAPKYWGSKDYNDPELPVVGVSWYEAEAYARWLTAFKNDHHAYRLPTEAEWERAARGDQGNLYPWGNEFDKDRCNSKEAGIGKPTRVSLYPNGVSPYGCYDMAGNVWEWTSSFYDMSQRYYTLRGGVFSEGSQKCRCTSRISLLSGSRVIGIGFRCARVKL